MTKTYVEFTGEGRAPIKAWVRGVPLDDGARRQLENTASLPFVYKWVAVMPDVHWGLGATVSTRSGTAGSGAAGAGWGGATPSGRKTRLASGR